MCFDTKCEIIAICLCRSVAPGVLDSELLGLQTLKHIMRVSRTWNSVVSLLPKGGDTIWGNLDWSPEDGNSCDLEKKGNSQHAANDINFNRSDGARGFRRKEPVKFGRIISFGKAASEMPSSRLPFSDLKVPKILTESLFPIDLAPRTYCSTWDLYSHVMF